MSPPRKFKSLRRDKLGQTGGVVLRIVVLHGAALRGLRRDAVVPMVSTILWSHCGGLDKWDLPPPWNRWLLGFRAGAAGPRQPVRAKGARGIVLLC